MPSGNYHERTSSTSGQEPLYLLEITHAQLAVPVRVARDTQDLVSNGENFQACWFDVQLPDQVDGKLPEAPLRIDNVGRELVQWLEASQGGKGAQVRVMQVMRDAPDVLEADITLDLLHVQQRSAFVIGRLGFEDTLNLPALPATYRPDNCPGIF